MLKIKWLALLFSLFLLAGCASGQEPAPTVETSAPTADAPSPEAVALTKIRLPMGYIPDPQYAPFYVAVDRGYYAEAGLEMEFDYSFETDGVALVGANELPFAIVSGEQAILARAQGVPVVYVLEWYQKFPIAVVSKASANISTPQDLIGRSVGLPFFFGASYVGYVGLLSANGIAQDQVNATEIGFTQIESLLTDQVEAVVGYANNEPVQLQAQGEAINVLYVADYVNLVANGIITNEKLIAENADLVQRFVDATLRGLADTLADPAAAYQISKKYVDGLDDNRMNVLEASLPLWQSSQLGLVDAAAWENTQQALLESKLLDAPIENLEAGFTNQFIDG